MKRLPKWIAVEQMMQPGRITRDGMLGDDPRPVEQIIEADAAAVTRLGLTHAGIAARLRQITDACMERLGDPSIIEGVYDVRVEEARGILVCPFKHPGRCLKRVTYLTHIPTGERLAWTDLGLHMIEAHGFYQGRGSHFRVDPDTAARVLGIPRAQAS